MMFSEEQIRDIVTLKEELVRKISDHQEAIDSLEKNLRILDTVLKGSSFTKASQMIPRESAPEEASKSMPEDVSEEAVHESTGQDDAIPIKQGSGGEVIARARVTPDSLTITIEDHVRVSKDTPPFKSFFMDRVIGDIRRRDEAMVKNGEISEGSVIECLVESSDTGMQKIVIRNYGQSDTAGDLINAAEWSLTRMLEKTGE